MEALVVSRARVVTAIAFHSAMTPGSSGTPREDAACAAPAGTSETSTAQVKPAAIRCRARGEDSRELVGMAGRLGCDGFTLSRTRRRAAGAGEDAREMLLRWWRAVNACRPPSARVSKN